VDCLPHILAIALHSQGGFNTAVPGLGLFCRSDSIIAGAGAYANSEKAVDRKVSQYLLAGAQPLQLGPVRLGAVAGLVNGYAHRSLQHQRHELQVPVLGSMTPELEQRANDLLAAVCKQREDAMNAAAYWQADAMAAKRKVDELTAELAVAKTELARAQTELAASKAAAQEKP
jgi:hypothetical protein